IGWNDIASERCTGIGAIRAGTRSQRIVEGKRSAGRTCKHVGEISLPLGVGRQKILFGLVRVLLDPFEVNEEKCLVFPVVYLRNPDRTADLKSIFVMLQKGNGRLLVKYPCLQMIVLIQLINLAVKLVGAAFCNQFDNAWPAILRVTVGGNNFNFLEGGSWLRIVLQFVGIPVRHGLAIHRKSTDPAGMP